MEIEDQQSGLPDCWFQARWRLASLAGLLLLRLMLTVEVSCVSFAYKYTSALKYKMQALFSCTLKYFLIP
jgi:hypothetical protein